MITTEDIKKSTVIGNIQEMQRKIGVTVSTFEWLTTKTYDVLHSEQNSLIKHYNQAIKNEIKFHEEIAINATEWEQKDTKEAAHKHIARLKK